MLALWTLLSGVLHYDTLSFRVMPFNRALCCQKNMIPFTKRQTTMWWIPYEMTTVTTKVTMHFISIAQCKTTVSSECVIVFYFRYNHMKKCTHFSLVITITKSIEATVAPSATIIHSCVSILLRLVDRCNASHQQLWCILWSNFQPSMMTSSNGNIFRVTGHLCEEFTGPRWIPHTKASDAELSCFLWSASEQTVE